MTEPDSIAANIAAVRARIAQAAARAGRASNSVTLIAVTKTVDAARVQAAYQAGVRDFGENYVQEALAKVGDPTLAWPDARWHFIGHLQTNKAREMTGRFALVQSVDSARLAEELARRARLAETVTPILLEVKLDAAESKFGLAPDDTLAVVERVLQIEGVELRGLMALAPFAPDPEAARPHFRRLRALFAQLPASAQQTLSMGMTGDFETAVEEGATHVRIGTAIFGRRAP